MAPRKRRSVDEHQLDLFADSEDVGRRNTVVAALLRRDALQAGAAIEALRAALPTDSILGPASVLHAHLIAPSQTIPDHASTASELQRLRETILPAADYLFGASSAAEWIRADWVAMAERIAGLEFDGRWPEIHSTALLCMLSRWEEGLALALRVPSWRRIAAPLSWVAKCRCKGGGSFLPPGRLAQGKIQTGGSAGVLRLRTFHANDATGASPAHARVCTLSLDAAVRARTGAMRHPSPKK